MLVVVALGGNALLRSGQTPSAEAQRRNVRKASRAISRIARTHSVVVTHGNGPQVGLLALQSEASGAKPDPLDVLGAESEGMIGYMIDQAIANALPGCDVATLLTQVEVDPNDPAFAKPTKPIGPVYAAEEAKRVKRERGWVLARNAEGYRRVVPSPKPLRILELDTIKLLVRSGVIVVCAGGGGIPVSVASSGVRGVEAVIDKDLSAALLATELRADALLLLTDVPAVYRKWGTGRARPIRRASPGKLRAASFEAGSMRPKVEAACRFAAATGGMAAIGALGDAEKILLRRAGTIIEARRDKR
jgi:carbamate kinase